jgi:hypothetical protein
MPAGTNPLAISEVGYTNATKVDIEKKLTETEPLIGASDEFVSGDARNPVFEISVEGKGDLPAGVLVGDPADDEDFGVTGGKTIVRTVRETEHTATWNDWMLSAVNFPGA